MALRGSQKVKKHSSFYNEDHEVMGGRAKVLRTRQSGEVWQLRMWVSGEGKYLRESMKTTDLETAINRAETRYLQIYSDMKTGRKIFGITLGELVNAYIKKREEDVVAGLITQGRKSWSRLSEQFPAKDKWCPAGFGL